MVKKSVTNLPRFAYMNVYIHSMFVFFLFVLPGARWRLELCSSKFRQEEEQKTSKKHAGGGTKRYLCCHTLIHRLSDRLSQNAIESLLMLNTPPRPPTHWTPGYPIQAWFTIKNQVHFQCLLKVLHFLAFCNNLFLNNIELQSLRP